MKYIGKIALDGFSAGTTSQLVNAALVGIKKPEWIIKVTGSGTFKKVGVLKTGESVLSG